MKEFVISEVKAETAILVGLITKEQDEAKTKEYLDELEFLADTAGAVTVKRFTQRVGGPSSVTYVGTGKLEEIRAYIEAEEDAERPVGMVIFDDELSAKQMRNIEKVLQVKILDRTSLILDIFAMRAQTAAAKTQVELAQYRYMLPRLQRLWTHLERQGGGSGSGGGKGSVGLRGPGETQLEMDRRIILNRITLLKQRLVEIDKQMSTQRKNRGRTIRVALVGYTNVGKSTIMNMLAKSEVFAENKLFATLDTTVRKVVIDNLPFLLADTVGFIRKLPTDLVDSFKSTLDETREADLLLHVVDISHPDFEEQIRVVENTLKELGCADKPSMIVFNKIDNYTWTEKEEDDLTPMTKENITLDELKRTWMARLGENCMFISAKEKLNIDEFRETIYHMLPRLQRLWTHLERQGGGSGSGGGKGSVGLRGPGETQLEMDRRIILNRITLLKQRLVEIDKQMSTQRKNRGRTIRVALVGYTNVGKSTIMNMLAKSEVFAENKLFATLDTTVRKVVIDNLPFLLADTVGFIRKLPTDLVDSFKSTLDETREADLLLHVVDISHPDFEEQIRVVENTLKELGCADKPSMIVFNKIDNYTWTEKEEDDLTPMTKENITLDELKRTWMARLGENCMFISAKEKLNIDEFRETIYRKVRELHVQKYPYNDFLYMDVE